MIVDHGLDLEDAAHVAGFPIFFGRLRVGIMAGDTGFPQPVADRDAHHVLTVQAGALDIGCVRGFLELVPGSFLEIVRLAARAFWERVGAVEREADGLILQAPRHIEHESGGDRHTLRVIRVQMGQLQILRATNFGNDGGIIIVAHRAELRDGLQRVFGGGRLRIGFDLPGDDQRNRRDHGD
ncbi:hypothetical protein VZ95_17260 [Elstera litoralis]|uniref:Uncharacterized protein n=1 Tax=Elstera litoralis TaxID=552518 RepID=A0A0F3IP63_9PROT|nr:hypothetical protein VZ95_17260 [Elstera litoralis]